MSVVPTMHFRFRHGYRVVKTWLGKERRVYDRVATLQQKFEVHGIPQWRNVPFVPEEHGE